MLRVLTVCTGNICRSPLAALMLQKGFSAERIQFSSAGTMARTGLPVTPEIGQLALSAGVRERDLLSHRSRPLTTKVVGEADLLLAMAREHRRAIVEINPSVVRRTFTIREFARLASSISSHELEATLADLGGLTTAQARLESIVSFVSSQRSLVPVGLTPEEDDVVDPYKRSNDVHARAFRQLSFALRPLTMALELAVAGQGG